MKILEEYYEKCRLKHALVFFSWRRHHKLYHETQENFVKMYRMRSEMLFLKEHKLFANTDPVEQEEDAKVDEEDKVDIEKLESVI